MPSTSAVSGFRGSPIGRTLDAGLLLTSRSEGRAMRTFEDNGEVSAKLRSQPSSILRLGRALLGGPPASGKGPDTDGSRGVGQVRIAGLARHDRPETEGVRPVDAAEPVVPPEPAVLVALEGEERDLAGIEHLDRHEGALLPRATEQPPAHVHRMPVVHGPRGDPETD